MQALAKQYAGVFGKIRIENDIISLAHPRVGREFLINIGTIVSEGMVSVLLRRRRLGSVEEGFHQTTSNRRSVHSRRPRR